jgi:hypothetical protein
MRDGRGRGRSDGAVTKKPNVLRTEKEWMGQSRCQELALLYVQVAVQRVGVVVSRDDVSGRGECRCES